MQLDLRQLDRLGLSPYRADCQSSQHDRRISHFSRLPHVVCLMKASISSNLFLGAGAYLAGLFPTAIRNICFVPPSTPCAGQGIDDISGRYPHHAPAGE
jgi:hypothetical protein